MLLRVSLGAVGLLSGLALPALAADPTGIGYVHIGAAHIRQADQATLFMGGAEIPGATFSTEGKWTFSAEAGVFVIESIALAVSGVIPVTTPNIAGGTLAGIGNLGDETVGFYSATAQYHFDVAGYITPYLGAGLGYMHVFDTTDGVVTDMNVQSAVGGVVQAGFDIPITQNVGVFADIKRYFISTSASGTMAGFPITANATVDPWVISSGIGISF
jgi:outer membrane protein